MPERFDASDSANAAGTEDSGAEAAQSAPGAQRRTPDYRRGTPEVQDAYRAGYRTASEEFRKTTSWRLTAPLRWFKESTRPSRSGVALAPSVTTQPPGLGLEPMLGIFGRPEPPAPHPVDLIREAAPKETSHLEWTWRVKGLDREPETFALYRIVGNDLYPRHRKGQAQENVRFILENEPDLADCEKRWVLNRIVDQEQEQSIMALLEAHGQEWVRIPFVEEEYRAIGWDTEALPEPGYLMDGARTLGPEQSSRVLTMMHRHKNNYVMNNNSARNAALNDGRSRAKWVLPWDGNCFLTSKAWEEIREAVSVKPWLTHFVVPMARVLDNAELTRGDFRPEPVEEPQLIFRRDTRDGFNEEFCYGRRPKVELFWRLGVPGKWDAWRDDPWDLPRLPMSEEAYQFDVAGWVARLFSGAPELEVASQASFKQRNLAREDAITTTIARLDRRLAGDHERGRTATTSFFDPAALDVLREALSRDDGTGAAKLARAIVADAEEALEEGPYSVVDKTTLPPSGNRHDYWHPAPYWWPNPDTKNGLPYIRKDGERVPGTAFGDAECDKFDRSRLQRFFDTTTALGLAWYLTGRDEFAGIAARNIRTWFVDPERRMAPHLRQAQVRMGHNRNKGFQTGIIEFKDIYFVLDAARILSSSTELNDEIIDGLRAWLEEYLDWLLTSEQGLKECAAVNNHGIYYDLQVAGIASYLDRTEDLREAAIRAQSRLPQHILPGGYQPDEMSRSTTAHYCFFNLQGWLCMVRVGTRHAVLAPNWQARPWSLLREATVSALSHDPHDWPYPQIDAFDTERPLALAILARQLGVLSRAEAGAILAGHDAPSMKPRFNPHDGIPPYWNAGIAARD